MAIDKAVDSSAFDAKLTSVADAIRSKGGTTATMSFPSGMVSAINEIETDSGDNVKSVNNITPDTSGNVSISGTSIPVSSSDSTTISSALESKMPKIENLPSGSDPDVLESEPTQILVPVYDGVVDESSVKFTFDDLITHALRTFAYGAGFHNSIYRGKSLGSSVTTAQWNAISLGSFTDLFIGDYWTIDGVNWRIAAFDYYYNTGDIKCTTHHIVIVPETNLYAAKMNATATTAGAYVGSSMYTSGLNTAKTTINNAFGEAHILSHRQYLKNAATNGYEVGGSWYDSTVELMNERNVYGSSIYENVARGANSAVFRTIDKSQYPLFAFNPSLIPAGGFWLRDVATSMSFSICYSSSLATEGDALNSSGVRPAFSICA